MHGFKILYCKCNRESISALPQISESMLPIVPHAAIVTFLRIEFRKCHEAQSMPSDTTKPQNICQPSGTEYLIFES